MLRLFDEYGAKLTIMADVAEIMKFKEHQAVHGSDTYHYHAIAEQLRRAVRTGPDVQLHLHSSYFNAKEDHGEWAQDWSEYDFASLPYDRMDWMIRTARQFLESLLQPVDPGYRCVAFRSANWSVSPSRNLVRALVGNGIRMDTSVFKHGRRRGIVNFDYSHAHSPIVPWLVSEEDICVRDERGVLWEVPIYSERRWLGAFISPGRVYRALSGSRHKLPAQEGSGGRREGDRPAPLLKRWVATAMEKHAWKADFNQCGGCQLTNALRRAVRRYDLHAGERLPFVLIGHSKLFTRRNEAVVRPFLAHSARHPRRYGFETLGALQLARQSGDPA
jgi:hypothetical protein